MFAAFCKYSVLLLINNCCYYALSINGFVKVPLFSKSQMNVVLSSAFSVPMKITMGIFFFNISVMNNIEFWMLKTTHALLQ